jgi:hypothetical protein
MPRRGSRLLAKLAEKLKTAPQKTDVKREIAEMLGPTIFYVHESRFEPVEDVEAVGEAEEAVEDGLEPAGEAEEAVEDGEYIGQSVVRRVFPGERVGRTLF